MQCSVEENMCPAHRGFWPPVDFPSLTRKGHHSPSSSSHSSAVQLVCGHSPHSNTQSFVISSPFTHCTAACTGIGRGFQMVHEQMENVHLSPSDASSSATYFPGCCYLSIQSQAVPVIPCVSALLWLRLS